MKNVYSAVALKKMIIFPAEKISLVLEGAEIQKAVHQAVKDKEPYFTLIFQADSEKSKIGVLAKIIQHWELSPTLLGLMIEGIKRLKIIREFVQNEIKMAEVFEIDKDTALEKSPEIEALSRNALEQFKKVIQMEGLIPMMLIEDLQKDYLEPERTSDIISSVLKLDFKDELILLEEMNIKRRLEFLNIKLANELNIAQAKKDIASTGEITLSGKVLKVGGIKEKILAAHRGGVKKIVLPKDNEKSLIDIPKEIRKELEFKFAKHMDEVITITAKN